MSPEIVAAALGITGTAILGGLGWIAAQFTKAQDEREREKQRYWNKYEDRLKDMLDAHRDDIASFRVRLNELERRFAQFANEMKNNQELWERGTQQFKTLMTFMQPKVSGGKSEVAQIAEDLFLVRKAKGEKK